LNNSWHRLKSQHSREAQSAIDICNQPERTAGPLVPKLDLIRLQLAAAWRVASSLHLKEPHAAPAIDTRRPADYEVGTSFADGVRVEHAAPIAAKRSHDFDLRRVGACGSTHSDIDSDET
jgi:hypothetical protein